MEKLERILLIDDDETNNFLNQRLINRMGFQARIKVLENGQLAFNYLYNICQENYDQANPDYFKPQLILVDLNMPVMDGFEFLEMYRRLGPEFRCDIALAMLTTSAHAEDVRKARENNIELLVKPLTAEMLTTLQKKYFPGGPEEEVPQDENTNKTAPNRPENR